MGRKGRISDIILTATVIASGGCTAATADIQETENMDIMISVLQPEYDTKAIVPEENAIKSLDIFIFEDGLKEGHLTSGEVSGNGIQFETSLVRGHRYSFYAVANIGETPEIDSIDDIREYVYILKTPEGFPDGLPMSGVSEDILIDGKNDEIFIRLTRAAAKVSLCIDRSRLSPEVEMSVRRVSAGNCPKYARLFGSSRVNSPYDRFDKGFDLSESQCAGLDRTGLSGRSETVSLYILENMQGTFPSVIEEDEEKVLDEENPLSKLCSYIEMEIYYTSETLVSYDSNLIYRFYLGDGVRSLDVERNCHYRIVVTPEDDGLSGSGWRVDKSGIGPSTPFFTVSPGNYIEGRPGDIVHITCDYYPKSAPFNPGYEELDFDKSRGIYDYAVDEEEREITLYLKKQGTGIVFPSAGYPVNQSELIIVTVRP